MMDLESFTDITSYSRLNQELLIIVYIGKLLKKTVHSAKT